MAKALPASVIQVEDDEVQETSITIKAIRASKSDPDRLTIELDRPVPLPAGHNICIDMGRRFMKIAYWKDEQTIIIDKLSTDLAVSEGAESVAVQGTTKGRFLAKNQQKIAAKNRVAISLLGKSYVAALRAQKLGGNRGLGQKKTENMLPRVLCALTLHGIQDGEVNLIMTIPFESDWATQEDTAIKSVEGDRVWGSDLGSHEVKINPLVVPESFYAEKFPRLFDPDAPNWEKIDHYVFDFGYQTLLRSAFSYDPITDSTYFDPDLSECFDNMGLSLFYKYVAEQCGYGAENAEDPAFIEAVNRNEEVYACQNGEFKLSQAIPVAANRYTKEITDMAKPSRSILHFQGAGGGVHRFWKPFCAHYEYAETYAPDLPELANIIGQAISLPGEFQNV